MFMSGNSNTHPRRKQPQFQYVTEIPSAVGTAARYLFVRCSLRSLYASQTSTPTPILTEMKGSAYQLASGCGRGDIRPK